MKALHLFRVIAGLVSLVFAGCPSDNPNPVSTTEAPATPSAAAGKNTTEGTAAARTPGVHTVAEIPLGTNHQEGFDADVLQFTDQGSGFFPMAVVRALKDSDTQRPYLENLERFGLVPGKKSARNPEGFPVGIVTNTVKLESGRDLEMFGFTCAACHTSDLHYQGKTVRVDGSSGLFYVDELGDQLGRSLKATLENPDELLPFLQRYAQNIRFGEAEIDGLAKAAAQAKNSPLGQVIRKHLHEGGKDLLARVKRDRTEKVAPEKHQTFLERVRANPEVSSLFASLAKDEQDLADRFLPGLAKVMKDFENVIYRLQFLKTRDWLSSDPAHRLSAGYGRADDFGTARVELFGTWNEQNMLAVNAPVSVPPLWNVSKYAWLHWNANTNSVIQRSIGEALGVGGELNPRTGETTVNIAKQMKIEEQVQLLIPPQWPEAIFGKIDPEKRAQGRKVYLEHCAGCHDPSKADDKGLVVFNLSTLDEVKTDPADATNFDRPILLEDGNEVSFAASIKDLLKTVQDKARAAMSPEEVALMDRLEERQKPAKWRDTMRENGGPVYPARPLEGIWATAPYLHNGSVPTLYHLLFPEERPSTFLVGQKDYDPAKVGFELDPAKITPQPGLTLYKFSTTIPGNLNTGHSDETYGASIPRPERLALLEYLKVHRDTLPTGARPTAQSASDK